MAQDGKLGVRNSECVNGKEEQRSVHLALISNFPSLQDVASKPIDAVADWMRGQPDDSSEDLKAELAEILHSTGGAQHREEFARLQQCLLNRKDLCPESLMEAHRAQLEILVAIRTGIQAFVLPDVSVTQSSLIEVFFSKRCRNMACQNLLPGDGCKCDVCSTKSGYCNACMCTICSRFDFDVNTCRWVGCDVCSHWTHTDCAIRVGQMAMGSLVKGEGRPAEMLFKCKACQHTSELFGWVKNVFQTCSGGWMKEVLLKEFDCVRRIFHGSKDSKGRQLFWKSEELLERLKDGFDDATACSEMQQFFKDLEKEDLKGLGHEQTQSIEPDEVCARIGDVVYEAVAKMETVADERGRALKRARLALETCNKDLEAKRKELQDLNLERERRKLEIEQLEMKVKLKVAEARMFQARADEARCEAESWQRVAASKTKGGDEEHSRYLKLQLEEVEAQRCALLKEIQLHELPNPSQMLMVCKIQDLLKRVPRKESGN